MSAPSVSWASRPLSTLPGLLVLSLLLFGCGRSPEGSGEVSARSAKGSPPRAFTAREDVITTGPDQLLLVRHLVLSGSNQEIGKHLGTLARERHKLHPERFADRGKSDAVAQFFETQYPLHRDRMRGVEDAFGQSGGELADWSVLLYAIGAPACSVVYYPPPVTAGGHALLSRNFDYPLEAQLSGAATNPVQISSREPYVMEIYPDDGYPSLFLSNYDLLAGVLDGINSEGLVVTVLSDDEPLRKGFHGASGRTEIGFHELLVPRFLLDTCATCADARSALRSLRKYTRLVPLHYLVADRTGDSFVWEAPVGEGKEYIIDGDGEPQIASNFYLSKNKAIDTLAGRDSEKGMFRRYRTLESSLDSSTGRITPEAARQAISCVSVGSSGTAAVHTLWTSLYDLEERSLSVSFLRKSDESGTGAPTLKHSEAVRFQLRRGD